MEEQADLNNHHSSLMPRQLSVCTYMKARGSGGERTSPHALKWEPPAMNTASPTTPGTASPTTLGTEGLADRGDQGRQQGEKGHSSLTTPPRRSRTASN